MEKRVTRILWERYWKILVLLFVGIVGFGMLTTHLTISNWQERLAYNTSEDGKTLFNQNVDENGKERNVDENEKDRISYEEWIISSTSMVNPVNEGDSYFVVGENPDLYFAYVAVVVAFCLFLLDLKTHFNSFLFSLGVSRKSIYWRKVCMFGGTFFLSTFLAKIYWAIQLFANIPSKFMADITLGFLIANSFMFCLLLYACFLLVMLLGMVLSEWVTAILTVLGVMVTLSDFVNGWSILGYLLFDNGNFFNDSYFYQLTSIINGNVVLPFSWSLVIPLLFISAVSLIVGSILFNQISLENDGHYLLIPKLRKPTLWAFTFYVPFTLIMPRIQSYYKENYGPSTYYSFSSEPITLTSIILRILLYTVVAYVIGKIVIYREIPLKKYFPKRLKGKLGW